MNYIYPIRTEKAGINGTENKIVFSKEVWMASGANTWKLDGMFDKNFIIDKSLGVVFY